MKASFPKRKLRPHAFHRSRLLAMSQLKLVSWTISAIALILSWIFSEGIVVPPDIVLPPAIFISHLSEMAV
jgi:hypothetical protein